MNSWTVDPKLHLGFEYVSNYLHQQIIMDMQEDSVYFEY